MLIVLRVFVRSWQVKSIEFSARLPSFEAADDGFSWIERSPRAGEHDARVTRLKCSLDECVVEKDLMADGAYCIVHYRGVHCHPRPLLHLRGDAADLK